MFEFEYRRDDVTVSDLPTPSFEPIDRRVLYGAAIVGILVNLNATLIPILRYVGGGLVAGFVAGYAGGRPSRGSLVGALVGGMVGAASGLTVVLLGALLGLFIEPPTILLRLFGPFNPAAFTGAYVGQLLLAYAVAVVTVAFDGLVGGAIGGGLKRLVRLVADTV